MDKKFAPNWHCVMGGSLGFEVTLRVCCFLLDSMSSIRWLMCSNNVMFLPLIIHASQVVCEKHSLLYMYYGGNVAILLFKF